MVWSDPIRSVLLLIQEPQKVYFIYCNRRKDVVYQNDVEVALSLLLRVSDEELYGNYKKILADLLSAFPSIIANR